MACVSWPAEQQGASSKNAASCNGCPSPELGTPAYSPQRCFGECSSGGTGVWDVPVSPVPWACWWVKGCTAMNCNATITPISAGCFSTGVTLLPAPKSHLHPEPAPCPGQGTPRQRLPPAPACARQVGQGLACPPPRAQECCFGMLGTQKLHGVPAQPISLLPSGRGPRGRGAR